MILAHLFDVDLSGDAGDEAAGHHWNTAEVVEQHHRVVPTRSSDGPGGREWSGEDDSHGRVGRKENGWLHWRRHSDLRLPKEPGDVLEDRGLLWAERHSLPPNDGARVAHLLGLAPASTGSPRPWENGMTHRQTWDMMMFSCFFFFQKYLVWSIWSFRDSENLKLVPVYWKEVESSNIESLKKP